MNRAAIFSFSDAGEALAPRVAEALGEGWEISFHRPQGNLKELTAALFPASDALIYIGAVGIAVRAIAPHIVHKAQDPAVLALDELGRNVIPLLSGHIGGANELARKIAWAIGANAVITTATDLHDRFAADVWATQNGLVIADMQAEKRFSAAILRGDLPIKSDFPLPEALPKGLYKSDQGPQGLYITCSLQEPFTDTLRLLPRALSLGIGCRRGVTDAQIESAVRKVMSDNALDARAIASASSIDVKQDENGLLSWARQAALPLNLYSAGELRAVEGAFTSSEFVQSTVGVDNVCERAAVRGAGESGCLCVKKTAIDGVTVALAVRKWSVRFE